MESDIRIKSPTYPISAELVIKHMSDDTILQLKTKIKDSLGNDQLVEASQKLIYAGHVLEDGKTLAQLNIPQTATFHLVTAPNIKPVASASTNTSSQRTTENDDTSSIPVSVSPSIETSRPVPAPSPEVQYSEATQATQATVPPSTLSASVETATSIHDGPHAALLEANPESTPVQRGTGLPHAGGSHPDVLQLLNRSQNVQRTNIKYELCYVDGFPYLTQLPDRPRRTSRRARTTNTSSATASDGPVTTGGFVRQATDTTSQGVGPTATRYQQVDLPTTAAIPVRTADGRRALILSPEGVRAMAARGINVESNLIARDRTFLGIRAASIRNFLRTGIPHGWLFLKLVFLVAMLGSDSSWNRFILINCIAAGIFFWQTGLLRNLINRTPALNPQAPAGVDSGPAQNTGTEPRTGNADSPAVAPIETARANPTEAPLLHNLGRAFLSSIVPTVTRPAERVPPVAVARPPSPARDPITTEAAPVTDEPTETIQNVEDTSDEGRQVERNREALVESERELETLQHEREDLEREREALQQQLQDW